jgi:hypothetical protein
MSWLETLIVGGFKRLSIARSLTGFDVEYVYDFYIPGLSVSANKNFP